MIATQCKEKCGWPANHRLHDEIHARLHRYEKRHPLSGVRMLSCVPWEDWSGEWLLQFEQMMAADQTALAKGGWRMTLWRIDNYNSDLSSIRHSFEAVRA